MSEQYFKISSGLKTLIGSELITDKFVAVFELVKNSFDADATEVVITFENIYSENPKIVIQDNGNGMDKDDLFDKWLFVAYSAKREDTEIDGDYRNKIQPKRFYAGAKGVGRFSCDRLGRYLNLTTIKDESKAKIENVFIDWRKFEVDQKKEFGNVPIEYKVLDRTSYKIKHGTILEITGVNENEWNRDAFVKLKDKLSKLVKPNLNSTKQERQFRIILNVPDEKENDHAEVKKNNAKGEGYIYRNTINGEIENFIFDELGIRTTRVSTEISPDGKQITTRLTDRDEFIYEIKEENHFELLHNISIQLYFLNRSAKIIFTKKMGIEAKNYGSVFVYKNGFRILPYGEPKDDAMGINARALQGFARYIGTRNLIGQIEVFGSQSLLRETTSRDGGLVKTKAYDQLVEFLFDTLKRLEMYIIGVTQWGVNDDNIENLNDEAVKQNLVKLISNITDDKALLAISYNKNIIRLIDNQEENSAKKLIRNFRRIAVESDDKQLLKDAERLEKTVKSALRAKESAEKEIQLKAEEVKKVEEALEQQIGETLFTKAVVGAETKELLSIQHHQTHTAQRITYLINSLIDAINRKAQPEKLLELVDKIAIENEKIITLSRFVTKANFDTVTVKIDADLVKFVNEYALNVYSEYKDLALNNKTIKINIAPHKGIKFDTSFRPIELIIILDNLLDNAVKAEAKLVEFVWEEMSKSEVALHIIDNGNGIPDRIVGKIFDFRFTTTNGSGLGLYHAKQIIEKMKGSITVNNKTKKGVEFILRFKK